jgi:hypothetical protein
VFLNKGIAKGFLMCLIKEIALGVVVLEQEIFSRPTSSISNWRYF